MRVRRTGANSEPGGDVAVHDKVSEMTKWLVQIDYLTSSGATKHWEGEVEAATAEAANEAGIRRLRQERQDVAGGIDVFAEPLAG